MAREKNQSQDACRKAGDEEAAARRAERHDQMADLNRIREESGGDYEPAGREDVQGEIGRERESTSRGDRHAAKTRTHDAARLANTGLDEGD